MLKVNGIKIPYQDGYLQNGELNLALLRRKAAQMLRIDPSAVQDIIILKRSIDARKKPQIYFLFSIAVALSVDEKKVLSKMKQTEVSFYQPVLYKASANGTQKMEQPIVVIGFGPAGMLCAYELAKHGYCPIVLERGETVEQRTKTVASFWENGVLNPASNVQFGEGGAGTFSDGKLNTMIKDKDGIGKYILDTFHRFGAPEEICYDYKPHLGTDQLVHIVRKIRNEIIALGGKVYFEKQVTSFETKDAKVSAVQCQDGSKYPCSQVVLAIGHSARDTFHMLYDAGMKMHQKAFAVGLRVEHPQALINLDQFGIGETGVLGAAPYKLTYQAQNGRSVYSFCMCPGGYVVNASSEEGRLAVNGMSYAARDSHNANSAIVMNVTPLDYASEHPLAGVDFQRHLEEKAYEVSGGAVPVQYLSEYAKDIGMDVAPGTEDTKYAPCIKGQYAFGKVSEILPLQLSQAFVEGMQHFDHIIEGFGNGNTLVIGVESRTSSPVRIERDDVLYTSPTFTNMYPCGEGAGYAGGITSAAMDGVKVAAKLMQLYAPMKTL